MKKPIRILQVVTIMNMGGLENFLMNIYRNIDRSKVQFDFLVHRSDRGVFDDEIERLGGKIFRMPPIRPSRFFSYQKELKTFFKTHVYKVVHSHLNENSALVLKVAKELSIPVRIAHSHAKATAGPYKFLRELIKKRISIYSTLNLACSYDAGKWLYSSEKFKIINNSIDVDRFRYSSNAAYLKSLKKTLELKENDHVVGAVARFSPTKNHSFMIDVFNEYLKLNKNAKLLLVGDGDLKKAIAQKCKELGLEKNVVFAGNVKNPEDYLSIMDIFLITSFNEGFGIVAVEAQCSGLPILMTDTIPQEIELTQLTYRNKLDENPAKWAKTLLSIQAVNMDNVRHSYAELIKSGGYDVRENAGKLINLYISELNNAHL